MIALRPGSGWAHPGPDGVLMMSAASLGSPLALPVRRDGASECEPAAAPDIRCARIVERLRAHHHPATEGPAMKAIRLHEPTGIDGLVFEEVPDAQPMLGDVLVKVEACGITHNELDWPLWTCRSGHRRSSIIPRH